MAIFAISDLHLSLSAPKPMDIFGPAWEDHAEKIRTNWEASVSDSDTVLIPGDISWAMHLSEARSDLDFVASLPGRKVLIRGNHDYWWQRQSTNRIQRTGDESMIFLQGTSVVLDNDGITGTRGWRVDWEAEDSAVEHSEPDRILKRELAYLEKGLQSIPDSVDTRIVMLHYPPFNERLQPNEFATLLHKYAVDILVYGHIHLGLGSWIDGIVDGVRYKLVSADIVDFVPQLILP